MFAGTLTQSAVIMWIKDEDAVGSPLNCCLVQRFPSADTELLDRNPCVAEHPAQRQFYFSATPRPSPLLGRKVI